MSLALITTTLAATLAPLLIPLGDPGKTMYELELEQDLEGALAELEPSTETTFVIATRLVAPTVAQTAESTAELTTVPIQPAERNAPGQGPADGAADESATLADWLALYCEGVGVRVVADEASLDRMRRIEVASFGQAFNIVDSLGEFQISFQDLLVTHGFVLTSNGAPKKYLLHDTYMNNQRSLAAYWVESSERELMASNPAILMSTNIAMVHVDTRQVSTMLRAMLPRTYEQALALSPSTLTLTTTGGKLAELLKAFDRIEAAEAASFAASAATMEAGRSGNPAAASGGAKSGSIGMLVESASQVSGGAPKAAQMQQLSTRIYMVDSENAHDVVRTAERLVSARYGAGLAQREWTAGDGSSMPWPKPRFYTNAASTRVLVQAAEEDMERIAADLTLAMRLHDGAVSAD